MVAGNCPSAPAGRSFLVTGNTIVTSDTAGAGIYFEEITPTDNVRFDVRHNDVTMGEMSLDGVVLINAQRASVRDNVISGSPKNGISLLGSTSCRIVDNHLDDLTPSKADIYLDELTSGCYVAAYEGDDVIDEGTDNKVVYREAEEERARFGTHRLRDRRPGLDSSRGRTLLPGSPPTR